MSSPSQGYQRALLDAIFFEQDQRLLEAFRQRTENLERRQQLAQVSGIRDERVLDRLIELDITPEAMAALELVPLVFVAWADGTVQAEERDLIVSLAEAAGFEPQDSRYPLLEHWLKRRPSPAMLQAWRHYVEDLRGRMSAEETDDLRHQLLGRAERVARAAGGFLGFGDKMSPAERAMLNKLEQAFA